MQTLLSSVHGVVYTQTNLTYKLSGLILFDKYCVHLVTRKLSEESNWRTAISLPKRSATSRNCHQILPYGDSEIPNFLTSLSAITDEKAKQRESARNSLETFIKKFGEENSERLDWLGIERNAWSALDRLSIETPI